MVPGSSCHLRPGAALLFEKVGQSMGQRLDLCNSYKSLLNPRGQQLEIR